MITDVLLVTVPSALIALGLRHVLRRYVPSEAIAQAVKTTPLVLGSVGGFFGLLAGFMLSQSWAEVRALRAAMTEEVNALADLSDISANLPTASATELKSAVGRYLEIVVSDELPRMAHDETSDATVRALTNLWAPLSQYQPSSDWEVSLRAMAIGRVMSIGEQRRHRIVAARERLPALLWSVLLCCALVVVVSACVGSLSHQSPAGFFLAAMTAIVALVLFSIYALDRPFQYGLATEAHDYVVLWQALGGPQTVTR